jgi:hypothetical protein
MPRRVDGVLARCRGRRRDVLAEIERLTDWRPWSAVGGIHCAVKGEAAYTALMLFKVVLLQRLLRSVEPPD